MQIDRIPSLGAMRMAAFDILEEDKFYDLDVNDAYNFSLTKNCILFSINHVMRNPFCHLLLSIPL